MFSIINCFSIFLFIFFSGEAYAQNSSHNISLETFQVSQALTQLRFLGLSLLEENQVDYVLDKLVEAHLALNAPNFAINEINLMNKKITRGGALIEIGGFYLQHKKYQIGKQYIQEGLKIIENIPSSDQKDKVLEHIAIKLRQSNDLMDAIYITSKIQSIDRRIDTIAKLKLKKQSNPEENKVMISLLSKTAHDIFPTLTPTQHNIIIFLQLAYVQVNLEDKERARATLKKIAPTINEINDQNIRERLQAALGVSLIYANDSFSGMNIIKSLHNLSYRVWGFSQIAYTFSRNDINSALPLISLAIKDANSITDNIERFLAYTNIIDVQTRLGLLKDAYRLAGKITYRDMQSKALAKMAMILIEKKQLNGAAKLLDNIPYFTLRTPIFLALAESEDQPYKKSLWLIQALQPTSSNPVLNQEKIPNTIDLILKYQLLYGDKTQNNNIIHGATNWESAHDNTLTTTRILIHIAEFLGKIGRIQEGDSMLNTNWPMIWLKKQDPYYNATLLDLVKALLALKKPIDALNVARQISADKNNPIQKQAFYAIVAFTASQNNIPVALHIMNDLTPYGVRSKSLGEIIISFTNYVRALHHLKPIETFDMTPSLQAILPDF